METLRRCRLLLVAGVIFIALSFLVMSLSALALIRITPGDILIIEPVVEPRVRLIIYLTACLFRVVGCVFGGVACAIMFADRRLELHPLERLAAMIGLLLFTMVLFTIPSYQEIWGRWG